MDETQGPLDHQHIPNIHNLPNNQTTHIIQAKKIKFMVDFLGWLAVVIFTQRYVKQHYFLTGAFLYGLVKIL